MKKTFGIFPKVTLLMLFTGLAFTQTSCEKEDAEFNPDGPPTITGLRAYLAAPNDSVITRVRPGTAIVIQGTKLRSTKAVLFDGVPGTFNSALFSDESIVVTIPADLPFAKVKPEFFNKIQVVTAGGELTYDFPVLAPAPALTSASYEYPSPGQDITVTGNFLYLIKKVTVGSNNVEVTDYTGNDAGTELRIKVPQGAQPGPITVQTQFGTTASVFRLNDAAGTLLNFDGVGGTATGSTISNDAVAYPGARGNYARLTGDNISGNNWGYSDGKRSIFTGAFDWLPASAMSEPAANYALKFEIFTKEPLSTGVIFIGPPPGGTWNYMYRYEPWKTTPNFKTTGWTTVVAPFNQFRLKANGADGTGAGAATVNDLLGGIDEVIKFMYVNDTNTPLAKLDIAIDNIRVVKIIN